MSIDILVVFCVIIGIIAFFYYKKFNEIKVVHNKLQNDYINTCNNNQILKNRLVDLLDYKNDISKTVKLLDKDIGSLNDKLEQTNSAYFPDEIMSLTPDILNTLFDEMNQERDYCDQEKEEQYQDQDQDQYQYQEEQQFQEQYTKIQEINEEEEEFNKKENNLNTEEFNTVFDIEYNDYKIN